MTSTARDALTWLVATAAVYLLLGQTTLHYVDGHFILQQLHADKLDNHRHPLFLPLVAGLRSLVGDALPLHRFITVLAALATAAGVAVTRLALARLDGTRRDANVATLLVAGALPVVFFATVVELHAPFFVAAQVGLLLTVRLERRPTSVALAAAVGATWAIGFLLHSSGVLLGVLFGGWYLAGTAAAAVPLRARVRTLAVGAVGALAVGGGLGWLLRTTDIWIPEPPRATALDADDVVGALVEKTLSDLDWVVLDEWLLCCAPLAWTWLLVARDRTLRGRWFAVSFAWLGYLALGLLILSRREYGVYFVPLLAPLAWLTVRAFPPRVVLGFAVAGTLASVAFTSWHDADRDAYPAYVAGLRAAAGDGHEPYALATRLAWDFGDRVPFDELGAILIVDRSLPHIDVSPWIYMPGTDVETALTMAVDGLRILRGENGVLLITKQTMELLDDPDMSFHGPALAAQIRAGFRLEPIRVHGFDGFALRDRG